MKKNSYPKIIAFAFILVVCVYSLCACSFSNGSVSKKNYLTIGRICPLTGEFSEYAEGTLETEQAAVEELNEAGGIYVDALDKKLMVRLLLEDSCSTEKGAGEAAKKLIEEENVDVIIVSDTGATVNAVSRVCEQAKVPCFCVNAEMDSWLDQGPYKYCFNVSYDTEGRLEALKGVIKQKGVSVLGLVSDGTKAGKAFAEKAQQYFTNEKINVLPLENGTDVIKQLKTGKADGLLCYMDTTDYISLKAEMNRAELGMKASMLVNEHWPYSELNSNSQSASFDETFVPVCWSPEYSDASSLTKQDGADLEDWWKSEYVSLCPESVGYRYGIIEVVVDVFRRAMAIDADSIVSATHDISVDTVLGNISFNRYNSAVLPCVAAQWHYEGGNAKGESKWVETINLESEPDEDKGQETKEETTMEDAKDSALKDK